MTQGGGETPGIGGVPGLPHKSGPSFRAWRGLMQTVGVHAPNQLRRAARTRRQLAALRRRGR